MAITPKYKLIMTYDINPGRQSEYSQFVLSTFVPGMQALQLYILGVYHTRYGDYPSRQAEFVSDSRDTMRVALESQQFQALEQALEKYIHNYARKVVHYRQGFQM